MFKRSPKPQPQPSPDAPAKASVFHTVGRLLPVGRIIDQVVGVMRDPNGKISSKRAGAGALVTAGIYFLDKPDLPSAITALAFATALFFLTKFEVPGDQERGR